MNSFHDLVIHRRSIRQYTGELLDPDQVRMILEAGLMAPAGKRRNPWHFVVVDDPETLQKLSEARAQAAVAFLVEHEGIDAARLEAVGKGSSELKNAEDPMAAENRRTEFIVLE